MKRGDVIVMADRSGAFTGKPRPALIVQSNFFPIETSITVCPITGMNGDLSLMHIPIRPSPDLPLARESWVEVDKVTTIRRSRVTGVIGRADPREMLRITEALSTFLGIA